MQRLVRVGGIDALLEQPRCQVFAGGAVALEAKPLVIRLTPGVPGPVLPRFDLVLAIGQHRKGRDDVLLEILVLVVAEHDYDIGPELVERTLGFGEMAPEDLPRLSRGRRAEIAAELFA